MINSRWIHNVPATPSGSDANEDGWEEKRVRGAGDSRVSSHPVDELFTALCEVPNNVQVMKGWAGRERRGIPCRMFSPVPPRHSEEE